VVVVQFDCYSACPGAPREQAFFAQRRIWASRARGRVLCDPIIARLTRFLAKLQPVGVCGFLCGRIFLPTMVTHNTTLEYLTTTRIGEKGQLTVPKQFREDLGLENGAPFAVLRLGDGLILLPEQQRFERLCQRVSSSLTAAGLKSEDLIATLPEARNRVYARHYAKKPAGSVSPRRPSTPRGK